MRFVVRNESVAYRPYPSTTQQNVGIDVTVTYEFWHAI